MCGSKYIEAINNLISCITSKHKQNSDFKLDTALLVNETVSDRYTFLVYAFHVSFMDFENQVPMA